MPSLFLTFFFGIYELKILFENRLVLFSTQLSEKQIEG